MKNIVYMVQFDWSTEDEGSVETYLFDTYAKALDKFNEIIKSELTPDMSWVADAFDKDGNVTDDYEFDTNMLDVKVQDEFDLWWNITDSNNYYIHDFLDLRKMEIL